MSWKKSFGKTKTKMERLQDRLLFAADYKRMAGTIRG
jgi:hypothetical protein